MADIQSRYPSITVTYDHITSYCYFYNYDGSTLLYTATCTDASDAVYGLYTCQNIYSTVLLHLCRMGTHAKWQRESERAEKRIS